MSNEIKIRARAEVQMDTNFCPLNKPNFVFFMFTELMFMKRNKLKFVN